jgi:hypothetical protein
MEKATKIIAIIATVVGVMAFGLFFFTGRHAQRGINVDHLLTWSSIFCGVMQPLWFVSRSSNGKEKQDERKFMLKEIIFLSSLTILLFLIWLPSTVFT